MNGKDGATRKLIAMRVRRVAASSGPLPVECIFRTPYQTAKCGERFKKVV